MNEIEEETDDGVLNLDISEGPQKVLLQIQTAIHRLGEDQVETVCLSKNFPSPRRAIASEKDVLEVLETIVRLPKVKYLKISYASGTFPIHLMLEALADCEGKLGRKSTIETLFLLGAKMAYSETVAAAKILEEHPTICLPSVSLENCTSESLPTRVAKGREKPMDVFLSAFAKLKTLDRLSLSSFHKVFLKEFSPFPWLQDLQLLRVNVCETSIRNICQSPRLESLQLDSMLSPPPERLLRVLGESLGTNNNQTSTNLHTLRLAFTPGRLLAEEAEAYNSFWEMVQSNTTLKHLHFLVKGIQTGDNAFGIPIALALKRNRALQRLTINTPIDANKSLQKINLLRSLERIASSLRSNETLQHFSFHLMGGLRGHSEDRIYTILTEPFCKVVEDGEQYTLQTLTLEYRNQEKRPLTDKMQFYLDLNRAGRYELLAGNPRQQDWVDAVVSNREDTSIVFFFLSRNPALIKKAGPSKWNPDEYLRSRSAWL